MGLIALCSSCHMVKHIGRADVMGYRKEAEKHLCKVNGWSLSQTQAYIEAQFEKWAERSYYSWDINIDWLLQFGIYVEILETESRKKQ